MTCLYCGTKKIVINGKQGMIKFSFCEDCYTMIKGWIFFVEGIKEDHESSEQN